MVMWNKKKEIVRQKQNTDKIIMTFTDTDLAGVLSKVGLVIWRWNFYFRDLHISMGLKPPKISATLTLPSIISPSVGLKNVFNGSKFSVALVL